MRFDCKAQWFRYYGLWNRVKRWSHDEFLEGNPPEGDKYAIRKIAGQSGKFEVGDREHIRRILTEMGAEARKEFSIATCAPDDHIVVQGNYDGTVAEVTFIKKTMGELSRSRDPAEHRWTQISRLQLLGIVGRELYDVLEGLIEVYGEGTDVRNNPVVEFSLYDIPMGVDSMPYVIWEVRHY
jgi:hypothetical protein